MAVQPDERGRRAPTPTALASLGPVPDGYRILPDPLYGQPLTRIPAPPAEVRLLLDRSCESAQADEPTQDYLAVRCDPRRLSFAVADGVGSSFLGDVAAQILSAHLADWLVSATASRTGDPLDVALATFLHGLSKEVMDQVAAWPLPDSVPGIVRSALDQQRAYGSEAMFACGIVDLHGGRDATVTVAWLGDAHLRVLLRDGQLRDYSGQTADRWSSRLGPRGMVRSQSWPVAAVARVLAFTDGLLPELEATVELPDAQLGVRLGELARRPGNDDMALIDVGLVPQAMPAGETDASSTLWRRLADEPQRRHARTSSAGSAWRRLIRAVGPTAPPPAAPTTSTPTSAPTSPAPLEAAREPAVSERPRVGRHALAPPAAPTAVRRQRSDRGDEIAWAAVARADSYAVEVCREPTFAEPLLYRVRGLSFALPPLPGAIFVRLSSVVADEPGPWGDGHDVSTLPATDPTATATESP